MYQLGDYNRRTDLTTQETKIRDFVLQYPDHESLKQFIQKFEKLEDGSIIILKRAILAGYWISYYGFNWTKDQEIEFWEIVYSKAPNSSIAILTLAESYRGNKVKSLVEVFNMYQEAIKINPGHLYSLSSEDFQELRQNPDLKFKFTDIELYVLKQKWEKEDFEEELGYIKKQCNGDLELEEYKTKRIKEIIKEKGADLEEGLGL